MKRLKTILGYTLAGLSPLLVLVMLFGQQTWMQLLVDVTGIRISPWEDGGAVVRTLPRDAYRIAVHEQVFMALVGEYDQGFVQLDWTPLQALPHPIDENVDYDGDGRDDFHLTWDWRAGKEARLQPLSPQVLGLEGVYNLKDGRAVRVRLQNRR